MAADAAGVGSGGWGGGAFPGGGRSNKENANARQETVLPQHSRVTSTQTVIDGSAPSTHIRWWSHRYCHSANTGSANTSSRNPELVAIQHDRWVIGAMPVDVGVDELAGVSAEFAD